MTSHKEIRYNPENNSKMVFYHEDGILNKIEKFVEDILTIEKYYNSKEELYNGNKPAEIHYYEDGNLKSLDWFIERENNYPSGINYYNDKGIVKSFIWYDRENNIHRIDGPAVIEYGLYGNITRIAYYVHEERHRKDGPAKIYYDRDGVEYKISWYYKDENYTDLVNTWIFENGFISWKEMSENDYNRMWMEII